jgi:hypothetical protein
MVLTDLGIGNTIVRLYADDLTDDQFLLMEQSVISVCKRLPVVSLGRRNAAAFFQDSPTSTSGTVLVLMVGRSSVRINLTLKWHSSQPIILGSGVHIICWVRSALHVNCRGLFAPNPSPDIRLGSGLTLQMISRHLIWSLNGWPSDDIIGYSYSPGRLSNRICSVIPIDWESAEVEFNGLVASLLDRRWSIFGIVHVYDVNSTRWDISCNSDMASHGMPLEVLLVLNIEFCSILCHCQ